MTVLLWFDFSESYYHGGVRNVSAGGRICRLLHGKVVDIVFPIIDLIILRGSQYGGWRFEFSNLFLISQILRSVRVLDSTCILYRFFKMKSKKYRS